MSADWIKMCADLQTHPKVMAIAAELEASDRIDSIKTTSIVSQPTVRASFAVIGALHAVWCIFDAHTTDGILHRYRLETLDKIIGWPGFSAAMCAVDWLQYDEGIGLSIPQFSDHNGVSAKRRAENRAAQKRSRGNRINSDQDSHVVVTGTSVKPGDILRTRERERVKEENHSTSDRSNRIKSDQADADELEAGFSRFWRVYPRKVGKANAEKAWRALKPSQALQTQILQGVATHRLTPQWADAQYIPHPATWLRGRRWEDELPPTASVVPLNGAGGPPKLCLVDQVRQHNAQLQAAEDAHDGDHETP